MGRLRILFDEPGCFLDRRSVGRLMAHDLVDYADERPVVIGVPKGGVVAAAALARAMRADFDVRVARRLGCPGNPDMSLGAVNEDGVIYIEPEAMELIERSYIDRESVKQKKALEEEVRKYRSALPRIPLHKRTVIVTDDGAVTGFSLRTVLSSIQVEKPRKLVVILPVVPRGVAEGLAGLCDEVICLAAPVQIEAVGKYYTDFSDIELPEVLDVLRDENIRRQDKDDENTDW
jgi:putative phosphoribosyl transferase